MTNITVTVLSDDIDKSKRFARYLASGGVFETVRETREELLLKYNDTIIRTYKPNMGQRGFRHNKLYVDSASPSVVEMTLEMFWYKILPIYLSQSSSRFKIEVKNPVEFLDFDKEIERYNRCIEINNNLSEG